MITLAEYGGHPGKARVIFFIMAKEKKSFILYSDLIHSVDLLTNEQSGKLFKHILEYVNDMNPETDELVIKLAFEPIKQSLKRDLKKFQDRAERSRLNGLKGGRPKTQKTQRVKSKPRKPDSDSDSDSVSVSVNVSDSVRTPQTPQGVIYPFDSEKFIEFWNLWKHYKKQEHRFTFKSASSEQVALKKLGKLAQGNEQMALNIIEESIANGWKGFFKLDKNGNTKGINAESMAGVYERLIAKHG